MKLITITTILLLLLPLHGKKQKTYGNTVCRTVIRIYDGDTFFCDIDNYPGIVGKNIGIRIYGIDTPEIRGSKPDEKYAAKKARKYLKKLFKNAKKIELRNIRRGKYFRIVAEVWVDGKNVAKAMIERGHAYPYYGKKKKKWKDWKK